MHYMPTQDPIILEPKDKNGLTDAMVAALPRAIAENRGIIIPKGDHIITKSVTLQASGKIPFIKGEPGTRLIMDGTNKTNRVTLSFYGLRNAEVGGFSVVQVEPKTANTSSLLFSNFSNLLIQNIDMNLSMDSGLYFAPDPSDSSGVTIRNVTIRKVQDGGYLVRIEGNQASGNADNVWSQTKAGVTYKKYVRDIVVEDCLFDGGAIGFSSRGGQHVTFRRCTFSNNRTGARSIDAGSYVRVEQCQFDGNETAGFVAYNAQQTAIVTDNEFTNQGGFGVDFRNGVFDGLVARNSISAAPGKTMTAGVRLMAHCDRTQVVRNRIIGPVQNGVLVDARTNSNRNMEDVQIIDNHISGATNKVQITAFNDSDPHGVVVLPPH